MASHSRRDFLRLGAACSLVASLPGRAFGAPIIRQHETSSKIRLGVASYSLRELNRIDAIAAVQALGTPFINLKSFHLPYELNADEIKAAVREYNDAGLQITGGGVVYLKNDDDADIRGYFEYAKAAGFPMMVIGPTPQTLPRIERFVREYDIAVAIHNHGPEDEFFPAPSDALKIIRDMDERIGVCADLGHTARTGKDVVQEIADAGSRLLDVHIKDLGNLLEGSSQCDVGDGSMPVSTLR